MAGLYCDFSSLQEQSIINIMGAILKRLEGRGGILDSLREAFQEGKLEFDGTGLRHVDLMGIFKAAIASFPQVFIYIDASDECLPKCLPEHFRSVRGIFLEAPSTRIFLTGRPQVCGDIQRYFTKVFVIPINPNADDTRNYVEIRLDRDSKPGAMTSDLQAEVLRAILEKIADMCVGPPSISTL